MIKGMTIAVLVAGLGVLSRGAAAAGPGARTASRAEDEEAIRRICLERTERFNETHEPPRAADFTPDADFVNVYGMWRKGAAEIEALQGERMKTVLKEARLTSLDLRIRFIRPDVAIAHQTQEMAGMLSPDGQKTPPHKERSIRVLVKERGKWLTTAFHNTIVREVAPPSPQ